MEESESDPRVFGGVKIAVDVPANAREALKRSPKTLPKPRERASTISTGLRSPLKQAKEEKPGVVSRPTVAKLSDTGQWKTKALIFYDQIVQEVERLLQTVEDKEAADKASDILKRARIPQGSRSKTNPENFSKQAEQVVTLLQRMQLQHPLLLRPPPT